MVGKYIKESEIINSTFRCKYINLSMARSIDDVGRFSLYKIVSYIKLIFSIICVVFIFRPNLVYVTPNAAGKVFFKDFIIVQLLKLLKQKVIVHYHNKGVKNASKIKIYDRCYRIFFKNVKVILLANALYKDISRYVRCKDVFICPNGIPETDYTHIVRNSDKFQLLFLSNMIKTKGVFTLLEACEILKDKIEFECNFIGGWGDIDAEKFTKEVENKNLSSFVKFYGALYGKDKDNFLKSSDIFIFPTFNECFPLVLLEAMQHGLPCISTNEGGITDIIDNNTGIIIEKENPQALADAIFHLYKNTEMRKKMGYNGLEKFKREFTLEIFEKRIIDIFNKCLS